MDSEVVFYIAVSILYLTSEKCVIFIQRRFVDLNNALYILRNICTPALERYFGTSVLVHHNLLGRVLRGSLLLLLVRVGNVLVQDDHHYGQG